MFNIGIQPRIKFFIISQKESECESTLNYVVEVVAVCDEVETVNTDFVSSYTVNKTFLFFSIFLIKDYQWNGFRSFNSSKESTNGWNFNECDWNGSAFHDSH